MKSAICVVLFLCIASSVIATSQVPAVPSSITGYTYYNPAAIKKNTVILNTFLNRAASFVIAAVNGRAIAPASYGVVLRGAFRKPVYTGNTVTSYSIIYYTSLHDPSNAKGKDYYGHFTATVNANGTNSKFVSYVINAALPHGTK